MRLEAVIVCKDYSDFLEHTLPENLQHIDRLVVVTHPDDKKTQSVCQRFGVHCVTTTVFHDDDDKFNKGRAINLGLAHLRHDGWVLHLDADIVLPHRFKQMLAKAKLNKNNIYGADRLNSHSYEHWHEHKAKLIPQYLWHYLVQPHEAFNLGSRLIHNEYGYCPIGYFQLFHSSLHRKYPIASGSAEHSDVVFAIQWAREHRILLPEIFVYHLDSDKCEMGTNWGGRKSKPYCPRPKPPKPYCK